MAAKKYSKREVLKGLPKARTVFNVPLEKELESVIASVKKGDIVAMGLIAVYGEHRVGCSWVGGYGSAVVLGANNLIANIVDALFAGKSKGN